MSYTHTIECKECGEEIDLEGEPETVICPNRECRIHWTVEYDAEWTSDRGWQDLTALIRPVYPCTHPPSAWRSCPDCTAAQAGV